MSDDYEQSRAALEAAFWKRRAELLAAAREQRRRVLAQDELAVATGIYDILQLRELISIGLTADTVTALAVVPLVAVAWASGSVHPREREVALSGAIAAGIPESSEAFAIYSTWLDERPDLNLLEVWGTYARALRSRVDPKTFEELRAKLLGRARKIAEAAGGPADTGAISVEEAAALEQIAALLR